MKNALRQLLLSGLDVSYKRLSLSNLESVRRHGQRSFSVLDERNSSGRVYESVDDAIDDFLSTYNKMNHVPKRLS